MQNVNLSAALVTYNGSRYLRQQLDSILLQEMPVNEIVVCDDGSVDGTWDILKSYQQNFPGLMRIYQNPVQLGAQKNFEKAIGICTGDWIFLSDQDDIWKPRKTAAMLQFAGTCTQPLLICSDADLIDDTGEMMGQTLWQKLNFTPALQAKWTDNKYAFSRLCQRDNIATGATVLIHARLKEKALPFPGFPPGYWQDCFLATLAAAENGLFLLDAQLIQYRLHAGQQVGVGAGVSFKPGNPKPPIAVSKYLDVIFSRVSPGFFAANAIRLKVKLNKVYNNFPENSSIKKIYRKLLGKKI